MKTIPIIGSHWISENCEQFDFCLCERTEKGLLTVAIVSIGTGNFSAWSISRYSLRMPAIVRLAKIYKNRSIPQQIK